MRIGFDGKRAAKNLTGLGNYSRWLIEQLAAFFPGNEYLVYTPSINKSPRIETFLKNRLIKLKLPKNGSFLWRSLGILKDLTRDGVRIYHGLSHELPFAIEHTPIKSVVTMHDLIFLRYPQFYKALDRFIYKLKSKSACLKADLIIAISEKTKSDIIEFYGIRPDKIRVIYQSCGHSFKQTLSADALKAVKSKYKLPAKFVLYVGTIESRKNLAALVTAFEKVDDSYSLVIIGRKSGYFRKVEEMIIKHNLRERILIFENMDFADFPAIYQSAAMLVLPSFYEGFGIPVIEALYSGIPVIAATGSCMEEAGGPDSIYIDPHKPDEISDAIRMVINDEELRARMISNGRVYVKRFDNELLAGQLMDSYLSIL